MNRVLASLLILITAAMPQGAANASSDYYYNRLVSCSIVTRLAPQLGINVLRYPAKRWEALLVEEARSRGRNATQDINAEMQRMIDQYSKPGGAMNTDQLLQELRFCEDYMDRIKSWSQ